MHAHARTHTHAHTHTHTHTQVSVAIGPLSVASELFQKSKSFGGDVLTTTDVAMVAGIAGLLPSAAPPQLAPSLVYHAMQEIHRKLETVIDKVKVLEYERIRFTFSISWYRYGG